MILSTQLVARVFQKICFTLSRATHTIRAEINSNDFGRFGNYIADSNSNFVVVEIIFKNSSMFCVFGVRTHTM